MISMYGLQYNVYAHMDVHKHAVTPGFEGMRSEQYIYLGSGGSELARYFIQLKEFEAFI